MNRLNLADEPSALKRILCVIRYVRESKGISTDYMALKLGYANSSGYCKLERGEVKELCIDKILKICSLLKISPFRMFILADISIFEPCCIQSWEQFFEDFKTIDSAYTARIKSKIQDYKLLQIDHQWGGG